VVFWPNLGKSFHLVWVLVQFQRLKNVRQNRALHHTQVIGMIFPVTNGTGFVLPAPLSILFFHFFAVVGLAG